MGLEAAATGVLRYRRPWYWLVVLLLAAVLATGFIAVDARARIAQSQRQFESSQLLRLHLMEQRIDDFFGDAIQLATTGSEALAPQRANLRLVQQLVLGLYRSHRNSSVYGLGVFYAPYAFDGRTRLVSVYDHAARLPRAALPGPPPSPQDHRMPGGIDEVLWQNDGSDKANDYTRLYWYRGAAHASGSLTFAGPYFENGRSFISTLKAVRHNGRLVGVMAVDTLTVTFKELMASALDRGDIGYIEGSDHVRTLLATAPMSRDGTPRIDRQLPLRYTGAILHLSSDAAPLYAARARIVWGSVAFAGVVWFLAGLLGFGMIRLWRSREATVERDIEQARLESVIAVGRRIEIELRKTAETDALTGLPNRSAFWGFASEAIATSRDAIDYAILFVDLDHFNMINDTLGHLAGDTLLKLIAVRLREALPAQASLSRLGGDEFVILLSTDTAGAPAVAEHILACLREPMVVTGRAVYTTASIGVVLVDASYSRPEELLRDADIAMYHAKRTGRARYAIFDTEMRERVAAESALENDLHHAIEHDEFVAYYQPIVDVESRAIVSFEALARWNRPGHGVLQAADFIGYAESHGLISAIDASILDSVCRDSAALFRRFPNTTIAINVSATQLTTTKLASQVADALRIHAVSTDLIRLEITETAVMTDAYQAHAALDQLHRNGIKIIVDDFGAGHSSLAYLHRLPIAGLKIDRSFVDPLATDRQAVAIVRSIVALAKTLGFYTVAEGVETIEQFNVLRSLGVSYAQGFLFSPAIELSELLEFEAHAS
ncbi:MAG TPA: EAL domain-containing protein [Candidatus Dormibacteraeota bacterium]|nr:EAL domain-containing protein [Candidatus Dormibacteraeota bacterium]